MHTPLHDLTVVIPTFNEEDNVAMMVDGIYCALHRQGTSVRILFVDDSPPVYEDGPSHTILAVHQTAKRYIPLGSCFAIEAIHRKGEEKAGGLSSAVMDGIERSTSKFVAVIDGDGQHPPAVLAPMLQRFDNDVDIVIASRYTEGGNPGGLDGPIRRIVSRTSIWLAKALFPRKLHDVSDPMTGCFMVRRQKIQPHLLRPQGFKVLLEILVTHRLETAEVPLRFEERFGGESKATMTQGFIYLRRLVRLRFHTT